MRSPKSRILPEARGRDAGSVRKFNELKFFLVSYEKATRKNHSL